MLLPLMVPMTLDSKISFWKKMVYSLGPLFTALSVSLGSAMFSQASPEIMAIYHIGVTPAALTTALFVFGFASGPIYGPLSELFGRKIIMVISVLYVCFSFAVATAKDIRTIMICRFSLGLLGQQRLLFLQLFFRFISDRAKGYRYFDICWGAFWWSHACPDIWWFHG